MSELTQMIKFFRKDGSQIDEAVAESYLKFHGVTCENGNIHLAKTFKIGNTCRVEISGTVIGYLNID